MTINRPWFLIGRTWSKHMVCRGTIILPRGARITLLKSYVLFVETTRTMVSVEEGWLRMTVRPLLATVDCRTGLVAIRIAGPLPMLPHLGCFPTSGPRHHLPLSARQRRLPASAGERVEGVDHLRGRTRKASTDVTTVLLLPAVLRLRPEGPNVTVLVSRVHRRPAASEGSPRQDARAVAGCIHTQPFRAAPPVVRPPRGLPGLQLAGDTSVMSGCWGATPAFRLHRRPAVCGLGHHSQRAPGKTAITET